MRTPPAARPFFRALLAVGALLAAFAHAAPSLVAPPDRFVQPGDYVTLVFLLEADEAVEVRVEAATDAAWTIVRDPGRIDVRPDRATPVAVTVLVPADAPAGRAERVTVRLSGDPGSERSASATLFVVARSAWALRAPPQVDGDAGAIELHVANLGNTRGTATLRVTLLGEVILERALDLEAFADATVSVPATTAGRYDVALEPAEGDAVRAVVRVERTDDGRAPPFVLRGELRGRLGSSGSPDAALDVRGALSDFTRLEANLRPLAPISSRVDLMGEHWRVSVGALGTDPLGLALPLGAGVGFSIGATAVRGFLAAGHAGGAVVAGGLGVVSDGLEAAFGVRVGGEPSWAARAATSDDRTIQASALRHAGRTRLTLDLRAPLADDEGDDASSFTVAVDASWSDTGGALRANAVVRHDRLAVAARGEIPVVFLPDANASERPRPSWSASVGWNPREGPHVDASVGIARDALQASARLRYAVRLQPLFGTPLEVTPLVGLERSERGVSLLAGATLSGGATRDAWAAEGLVRHDLASGTRGRLALRVSRGDGPLQWNAAAALDAPDVTLAASGGVTWRQPTGSIGGTASVRLRPADANPLALGVSLSGTYAFDVVVPDAVTRAAGGRNEGRLTVAVVGADGAAIEGATVRIGSRYLRTGAGGLVATGLPPGEHAVTLEPAGVPVRYRLPAERTRTTTVALRGSSDVTFVLARSASLAGTITGPGASGTRLELRDAEGTRRTASGDEAGRFEFPGLPPGRATLTVVETPLGANVIGERIRTIDLTEGEALHIELATERAPVATFGGDRPRIREGALQSERVPPGAAPLLRVVTDGPVERVTATLPGAVEALEFDGVAWTARLPIPDDATGLLTVTVEAVSARGDDARARLPIIVDPGAAWFRTDAPGATTVARPVPITVTTFFPADRVSVTLTGSEPLELEPNPDGTWTGTLAVPAGTPAGILEYVVRTEHERATREETRRLRVLE